jgi:hypothetical protein
LAASSGALSKVPASGRLAAVLAPNVVALTLANRSARHDADINCFMFIP